MSFDTLHTEIWQHVLSFLTPPQRQPLSGLTKEEAIFEMPNTLSDSHRPVHRERRAGMISERTC